MPSYPIRPVFPIDIRPTPSVTVTRTGTAFSFNVDSSSALQAFKPSRNQFFAALEAARPGATATVTSAVPADPSDPINRAFVGTLLVTATSALALFAKSTLGLTDAHLADVIASARLITE